MAVPDFQTLMLPFLEVAGDGNEHTFGGMANALADQLNLSAEERNEMVPSGRQTRLMNRVYWISTHFKNARLIESLRRGAGWIY
jgi:restriction system protein